MAFDSLPLVRFIDDSRNGVNKDDVSPGSRELEITVSDARQIFPRVQGSPAANLLLLAAGTIRFGQDGDNPLEDDTNELNEDSEVDFKPDFPDPKSRTMQLFLAYLVSHPNDEVLVQAEDGNTIVRSASFAALGNSGLTTDDDDWRVATENASLGVMTATRVDLCLRSDVSAHGADIDVGGGVEALSQLNRSGFQVALLARRRTG